MPSILTPNIPQDTERKHRTQDTNTAHNRRLSMVMNKEAMSESDSTHHSINPSALVKDADVICLGNELHNESSVGQVDFIWE